VLKANARTTVVDRLQAVEIRDEAGTRQITDDIVELSDTGQTFRRVTVEDTDGEVTACLTTLDPTECAPIDVVSIYTLRWLIEILFRELKQYRNVEQFQSPTLNGALFELFCTWIAYLLVQWSRLRHPLRGGVRAAIRLVQVNWNRALPEYG
jgi:IS4 transposase